MACVTCVEDINPFQVKMTQKCLLMSLPGKRIIHQKELLMYRKSTETREEECYLPKTLIPAASTSVTGEGLCE